MKFYFGKQNFSRPFKSEIAKSSWNIKFDNKEQLLNLFEVINRNNQILLKSFKRN